MFTMAKTVGLSNGSFMPVVGLGTSPLTGNEVKQAVVAAIRAGYRHIDTAYFYRNEADIGQALQEIFKEGSVKRKDLFITSKMPPSNFRTVREFLEISLKKLQMSYVDLYLVHTPVFYKGDIDEVIKEPRDRRSWDTVDLIQVWKDMEVMVDVGMALAIGVSNFNSKQIKRICDQARIKPISLQVECHPYLSQEPLGNFCSDLGINFTSYCPLGSPERHAIITKNPSIIEDPLLKSLGSKYNKSSAQIALRWQIQLGNCIIPKSKTPARIRENIEIFDFELSDEDMTAINGLNKNMRMVPLQFPNHPEYPFNEPF